MDSTEKSNLDSYFDTIMELYNINEEKLSTNRMNDIYSRDRKNYNILDSKNNSIYSDAEIDRMLNETEDNDRLNNEKIEYINKSLDIIDRTMLDIAKRDKELEEISKKREKFENSLQKTQFSLDKKYVSENIKINESSGSINTKKKKYIFGESLSDRGELFSIKLPNMEDYVYLNINVKINGKYNKDNTMILGITDKKKYWAIERGNDSKLEWHYNNYTKNTIQDSNKTVNDLGTVNDNMVFNIDYNKQLNKIKMYVINGNNEIEWIPKNSILPDGKNLHVIVHRGSNNDQYTFNNIQIDINKSFVGQNKISTNVAPNNELINTEEIDNEDNTSECNDKVCKSIIDLYLNYIYFLIFIIICLIIYFSKK